jgi:Phage integrase, N-terminal SAM-like domain
MKGHIRERSPGHWAIILEQRDPASGQRKRRWHSFAGTKRAAQVECARLISEMQRGTYLEPNKTMVAKFLDRWLADVKTRVSAKTYERYEQAATRTSPRSWAPSCFPNSDRRRYRKPTPLHSPAAAGDAPADFCPEPFTTCTSF